MFLSINFRSWAVADVACFSNKDTFEADIEARCLHVGKQHNHVDCALYRLPAKARCRRPPFGEAWGLFTLVVSFSLHKSLSHLISPSWQTPTLFRKFNLITLRSCLPCPFRQTECVQIIPVTGPDQLLQLRHWEVRTLVGRSDVLLMWHKKNALVSLLERSQGIRYFHHFYNTQKSRREQEAHAQASLTLVSTLPEKSQNTCETWRQPYHTLSAKAPRPLSLRPA